MRMAHPRLGDAGVQAILELVGQNDKVKAKKSAKPAFVEEDVSDEPKAEEETVAESKSEDEGEAKADEEE